MHTFICKTRTAEQKLEMKNRRILVYLSMAVVFTILLIQTNAYAADADDNAFYMGVGGRQIKVQMVDNAATQELKRMLAAGDLTIPMTGNSFEQYGSLGKSLPSSDAVMTAQAGDVLLYNSDTLCIFDGSNRYSYTSIGKIQGLGNDELKEILSGKNLTITLSENSFGAVPATGIESRTALHRMMLASGCIALLAWGVLIGQNVYRRGVKKCQDTGKAAP